MITALVRTDRLRRTLPVLVLPGALAGLVLRGIRMAAPEGLDLGGIAATGGPAMMLVSLSLWGMAVALLLSAGMTSRGGVFALGLPLRARTIWIARMIALGVATTVPVAVMTVVAALDWSAGGGLTLHLPSVAIGVRLLVSLLLPVAVLQALRPDLRALCDTPGHGRRLAGAVAISLLLVAAPVPTAWSVIVGFLGTGVLIVITYLRIPQAFSLVGLETMAEPSGSSSATAGESRAHIGVSRKALLRVLVSHPASWFILPILVLYGFQTLLVHHEGADVLLVLCFPMIWIPFVALHSMSRIGPLDPLPIPRRRLFRWIVLPAVAAYLGGLLLYDPIAGFVSEPPAPVRMYAKGLRAPNELWEFAPGGTSPSITAPWGESHTPEARTVIPGTGIAVYFPFAVPREASPRYSAWQSRRALAALRGGDPSAVPAPTSEDPLVQRMATRSALDRWENLRDPDGVSPVRHERTLLVFAFGPLVFWLAIGWMGMHPRLTGRSRGVILLLAFAVPAATVVLAELASIASGTPAPAVSVATSVMARRVADAIPLGTAALAGCVALAAVVVYLVLALAFERFEAPRRPAKHLVSALRSTE